MTQASSMPLKMLGQPWPGINTRGGILDMGNGQLTDRSTNVIINTMDTLEKRLGFVRGLDERFTGAVCGLHPYTDEQGREWLIVVDENGFNIRQPFDVPVFAVDDSFPNDGFTGTSDRVNLNNWIDPALAYEIVEGRLRLRSGLTNSLQDLRWFKETPLQFLTEVGYSFQDEDTSTTSLNIEILHSAQDFSAGGIHFDIERSLGAENVTLTIADSAGNETNLGTGATTSETGIVRLEYNTLNRVLTVQLFPTTGSSLFFSSTLTEAQENDLGGWYGLRIETDTVGNISGFEQVRSDTI